MKVSDLFKGVFVLMYFVGVPLMSLFTVSEITYSEWKEHWYLGVMVGVPLTFLWLLLFGQLVALAAQPPTLSPRGEGQK
jgi:hypothetical protein